MNALRKPIRWLFESRFVRGASPTVEYAWDLAKRLVVWIGQRVRLWKQYQRNLNQDVVNDYRQRMIPYRELKLSRDHQSSFRRSIARAQLRLAFANVLRVRVDRSVFVLVILAFLVGFSIDGSARNDNGGHVAWLVFDPLDYVFHLVKEDPRHLLEKERVHHAEKASGQRTHLNAMVLRPGFSAVLVVLVLMGFFFGRSRRSARWPMFGALVVGAALGLTFLLRTSDPDAWTHLGRLTVGTIAAAISIAVLLFAVDVLGSGLAYGFLHWRRRMYPDAIVLDGLINILHRVAKSPERWPDLSFRRELASRIEEVALAIQFGFPGRLRISNPITNSWVREVSVEQAAAVRELEKWLMTPKADTRDRFIERTREMLERCATGDWDALERRPPEKLTAKQLGRRLTESVVRVIAAFIPIGILLTVRETVDAVVVPEYLYVFAIVWTIGALITWLDPQVVQRVAQQKDIFDFVKAVR